jgi:hypothetical protein
MSSLWGSYYVFIRRFDLVHKFLGVFKNIEFWHKTQWVSLWVYRKTSVRDNKLAKNLYFLSMRVILCLG